jgi:hypothetical protein
MAGGVEAAERAAVSVLGYPLALVTCDDEVESIYRRLRDVSVR